MIGHGSHAGVFSADVVETSRRLLDSVCAQDVELAIAQLSSDARLESRGTALIEGKPGIRRMLIRTLSLLESIRFVPAAIWAKGNVAIVEADVSCERLDGASMHFPLTLVLALRGSQVAVVRAFTYEPDCIRRFLSPLGRGE